MEVASPLPCFSDLCSGPTGSSDQRVVSSQRADGSGNFWPLSLAAMNVRPRSGGSSPVDLGAGVELLGEGVEVANHEALSD